MNEQEITDQLVKEGFGEVAVYADSAGFEYATHTHEKLTAHVILVGEMELTDKNGTKKLIAGERFDIPAGTTHSVKMGSLGCKYIIGEK
ncbi:MAG: hypothetical protein WC794_03735 [Candidatus Doudnabacteria bacterium]|jgi:quercetin dioxygenase-like cupin family protein